MKIALFLSILCLHSGVSFAHTGASAGHHKADAWRNNREEQIYSLNSEGHVKVSEISELLKAARRGDKFFTRMRNKMRMLLTDDWHDDIKLDLDAFKKANISTKKEVIVHVPGTWFTERNCARMIEVINRLAKHADQVAIVHADGDAAFSFLSLIKDQTMDRELGTYRKFLEEEKITTVIKAVGTVRVK